MKPKKTFNTYKWNEASAEAIIRTVAVMIADAVLYRDGEAQWSFSFPDLYRISFVQIFSACAAIG